MFTIWGNESRPGKGVARRDFIKVGAIGGMLTLADALRLQTTGGLRADSPTQKPNKSVIMVYLLGGPAQLDTYDPKPEAPAEYRGEFKSIATNVSGINVSELFPRQAAIMDKLAIIRSLSTTTPNGHSDSEVMTGFTEAVNPRAHHPCMGAVISKLRAKSREAVPAYVSMRKITFPTKTPLPQMLYYLNPGYLGPSHVPFEPTGQGMADLAPADTLDSSRMVSRQSLLRDFDRMRRDLDNSGAMAALDPFQARAMNILTSGRLRDALDLTKEDPRVVERYSFDSGQKNYGFASDYAIGTQLLLARRLVEVGVGFVEVALGYWDTHGPANVLGFPHLRNKLCPTLDQALTALIEDLHQRGLEKDVIVVVWGEFGRSPKINKDAGRDHWLPAMSAAIAGGGLKTGQVIGSTDSRGEFPKDRPYKISNVLSTIYHALGIDPATTFMNHSGRPTHLLDDREPIRELL